MEYEHRANSHNRDIFAVLAESGVIAETHLANLKKMAQFRNLLVHDYARIDPEIIYAVLYNGLNDIEMFFTEIKERFLPY
ncbi:DUF86 domain-containing protein [Heliobacterium gestii]|uniref:DUF86 domain-containing protein n=1 Tax=Heliomicrobium gestii TaxID=2699 RepID=A0A845LAB8_HELGE|nr:uncharacterized protein YutE (UPF0331/DUF86 family) [Heliomicrobium gestii]MZP43687.1 DUF86 domain-containing protein [Heliomicrobium gestii]